MKKIYLLTLIFSVFTFSLTAQTTDVATGLNYPWGIVFKGDVLYITEAATGSISKINVNDANPAPSLVVSGLGTPIELAFNGNDLYINEFDLFKISKINVLDAVPAPTDVITGLNNQTYNLQIKDNMLYYGESVANKISKINLADSVPAPVTVAAGFNSVSGITFNGSTLYISESEGNKISKINIDDTVPTKVDVITNLSDQPYTSIIYGNELYILLASTGKIVKIDLTATNPTLVEVVTGISLSRGMAVNGNSLYISDFLGNKIIKYQLPALTTTDLSKISLKVFPNPVLEELRISGLTKRENYKIFSATGAIVGKGTVFGNEKIDVKNLIKDMYFLKIENHNVIKFIKK